MYQILKKIKEAGKIISIFNVTEGDSRFRVGFIASLNKEEMLVKLISPNGEYDGYMWLRPDTIFQCNFGGEYEKKIMDLYDAGDKHELDLSGKDIRKNLLDYSISNNKVLEIEYVSDMISGYVMEYSDTVLLIREVDQYGKEIENVCIKMEVVDTIYIDTITCREMEKLHERYSH